MLNRSNLVPCTKLFRLRIHTLPSFCHLMSVSCVIFNLHSNEILSFSRHSMSTSPRLILGNLSTVLEQQLTYIIILQIRIVPSEYYTINIVSIIISYTVPLCNATYAWLVPFSIFFLQCPMEKKCLKTINILYRLVKQYRDRNDVRTWNLISDNM